MENNITYILTHHSENTLRDNNLSTVLSWLKSLKGDKEIILVEQGKVSTIKTFGDIKHLFAFNDNLFSKAWGMNI